MICVRVNVLILYVHVYVLILQAKYTVLKRTVAKLPPRILYIKRKVVTLSLNVRDIQLCSNDDRGRIFITSVTVRAKGPLPFLSSNIDAHKNPTGK